jgi:hypothetical protein
VERFLQSFVLQIFDRNPKPKGEKKTKQNKEVQEKEYVCCFLLTLFFFFGWRFFSARKNGYYSVSLVSQNFLIKIAIPNRLMIICLLSILVEEKISETGDRSGLCSSNSSIHRSQLVSRNSVVGCHKDQRSTHVCMYVCMYSIVCVTDEEVQQQTSGSVLSDMKLEAGWRRW